MQIQLAQKLVGDAGQFVDDQPSEKQDEGAQEIIDRFPDVSFFANCIARSHYHHERREEQDRLYELRETLGGALQTTLRQHWLNWCRKV